MGADIGNNIGQQIRRPATELDGDFAQNGPWFLGRIGDIGGLSGSDIDILEDISQESGFSCTDIAGNQGDFLLAMAVLILAAASWKAGHSKKPRSLPLAKGWVLRP